MAVSVVFAIINGLIFQDFKEVYNNYFLFYESISVTLLCLMFFYDFLLKEETQSFFNPKFIYTSLLLVFWSFTFVYWILVIYLYDVVPQSENAWINTFIWAISLITYLGFGLVFLFYKRLQPARE